MEDPVQIWKELEAHTNTANSSVGRMSHFRKFSTLRPTPGQPVNACFAELLDITTELAGSEEAVSDMVLRITSTQLFLPPMQSRLRFFNLVQKSLFKKSLMH